MHIHSDETCMIIIHLTLSVIGVSDGTRVGISVGCAMSATRHLARDYGQGFTSGAHYEI
jgi:hypothetical protein